MASSTRKPPKEMQRASPLSKRPRQQEQRGMSCFLPVWRTVSLWPQRRPIALTRVWLHHDAGSEGLCC